MSSIKIDDALFSTKAVLRNKYTAQFKEQALERADRDGIPKVARDC